jgi:hypothetical protein
MVWVAAIGLVAPQVRVVSAADVQRAAAPRIAFVDVSLSQDNLLRGQLVNGEGIPKAKSQVTLASGGEVVARGVTDEQGFFALKVEKGGVYALSDGETATLVRAWTSQAAPPSANNGVLMVSDRDVTRAALGNGGLRDVVGWAAVIGVVTAVIVAAADNDAS